MQSTNPIIWNYGGGWQSVALAVLIKRGVLPRPERGVIANTGRESSATWRYLTEHAQPLLDSIGLTIEIIPHSYALRDLYDGKNRPLIPAFTAGGKGQTRAYCSGEWKRDVVYRWLREPERGYGPRNPIIQWIGYSRDEIGRCKPAKQKYVEIQWPLIMGYGVTMTRAECGAVILAEGLPLPVKSACSICPWRTNAEWAWQKEHEPADHLYAIQVDREITRTDERDGLFLHRSGVPLEFADLSTPDAPEHPLFGRGEGCDVSGCFT